MPADQTDFTDKTRAPRLAGLGHLDGWTGDLNARALRPPVTKAQAEAEFGALISDDAWQKVCDGFRRHGERLERLSHTRANANPNDENGFGRKRDKAQSLVERAINALEAIDLNFIDEADELASLARDGGLTSFESRKRLQSALAEIDLVALALSDAAPVQIDGAERPGLEILSKAQSRQALARDLFEALAPHGATLSNGWTAGQNAMSYSDLTGFERLIESLAVHAGDTPSATARWVRAAIESTPGGVPSQEL